MYRKRLLYDYTRVTIALTLILIAYTFFTGFVFARLVMLGSLPVFGIIMYYSKKQKYRVKLSNFYIGYCSLIAFSLCLFSGGINSEMLPWFAIIPLLALLLQEQKAVLSWSFVCLLEMSLLFFTDQLVIGSEYNFNGKNILGFNFILSISLISLITIFVLIIDRLQQKARMELSETIEDLRAAEEELRQSMEELSTTQEILNKTNNQLSSTVESLHQSNNELIKSKLIIIKKKETLDFYSQKLFQLPKMNLYKVVI